MRTGNRKAAFTLVVLTPLIAELSFSTPLRYAWLVLLWMPIYGAGVLLIRETVRRTGRGWPSVLLLGAAFELIEDGIGLQALSSPHLYHAADWGIRILGLNVTYWEANVVYHMVFTVAIPILLADLLFPAHRDVPYLKNTGLAVTTAVALLGVGILRVTVPPSQDPGYAAPLPVVLGCIAVTGVLAVVALRILPVPAPRRRTVRPVPPLWALCGGGAVGTCLILVLLFPPGDARQPVFTQGPWVLAPMLGAAAAVATVYLFLARWTASTGWTDLHALCAAGGALVGHCLVGTAFQYSPAEQAGLVGLAVLTTALLFWLARRVRHREAARAAVV